jgi:glyoxylase-like metal-dependent hydrolase (beta-lactamase superfamily II)
MRFAATLLLVSACSNAVQRESVGDLEVVTVRRAYNNAHLLTDGALTILVDAGLERDVDALVEGFEAEGVDLSDLDAVVITH